MTTIDSKAVISGIGSAIADVVSALVEKKTSVRPTDTPPELGYVIAIEARRGGRGILHAIFNRSQAEALAKRMSGSEVEPAEDAVLASLKEVCGQAATSFVEQHHATGALLDVVPAQAGHEAARSSAATLLEISTDGEGVTLRMALAGTLELNGDSGQGVDRARQGGSPNLDVILDIDLPLVVRFGRTEMSLKDLTELGPGSLINLACSPEDSVDVLVSNQIVAKGEVVAVAGNYGVRIRDVVSPAERVRSMGVEF